MGEAAGIKLGEFGGKTGICKTRYLTGLINVKLSQGICGKQAEIAYPNLAKVGVEGSNPFARSKIFR